MPGCGRGRSHADAIPARYTRGMDKPTSRVALPLALAATVMFATAPRWWMAATGTAIMAVVALWLWRRLEPPGHP